MLREFAIRFLVEAVAFGIALTITCSVFSRKRFSPFWILFLFGFALTDAACRVVFKHYPDLSTGWLSYVTVAGIALAACLPVILVMLFFVRRRQRHDHDA